MFALEKDVVMGTFTHRETYLNTLCRSVREKLPQIMFLLQLGDNPIAANFNLLREKFQRTGRRFWLFLDDDITFLYPDTVRVALETMVRNRYAMVGVYSTFDPYLEVDPEQLVEREVNWTPGYFQLVDSSMVGHIAADTDLPDLNTSVDTSYCVRIKQEGHKIGIAPTCVLHAFKTENWVNQAVIEPTNRYLMQRYGQQYFDWCHGLDNVVGRAPDPEMEPMRFNRRRLIEWQATNYVRERGKKKIHFGCGRVLLPGFINCDIDEPYDRYCNLTEPLPWKTGTVDHITCHHVLEHIHYRQFNRVLDEWVRILKPGGTIDIGMPDLEVVARAFIEATEEDRWNRLIYVFYGQQGSTEKRPAQLTDADPIIEGQCHRGGLTLSRMVLLLESRGMEILEAYNYDGNGTPSLFVLARKKG